MTDSSAPTPERWDLNYFNYFTEVEEHFQKARGTSLFLLSPVDWALIETWKNAGVPLAAVIRGIDAAFGKWRERKGRKVRMINSLAYCTQAVIEEAQIMAGAAEPKPEKKSEAPFSIEELRDYLTAGAQALHAAARDAGGEALAGPAGAVDAILADLESQYADLEQLEQRLTAVEEKIVAVIRASASEDELFEARRSMESHLRPYRGKMSAEQIAMLEKQYLDRTLLERRNLPRLSLFYLR